MSIIITKWTTWDDTLTVEESNVIGALGGFFKEGMRWKDYIDRQPQDWWVYLEAIRAEVIAKNHRFCGDIHQQMRIPVFSDGKVGRFSYRAWGDLMAAIWAEAENNNYRYMDFYCTGSGFTERGTTCPGCGIPMSTQLDLPTAIAQGKNQAAACLEKTRQTKSDWPERAAKALQTFIWQQKMYDRGLVFTSEQAVQYCYDHGLTKAHDDRAFGGVLQKLAHKGVIKRSAITYQRAKGHGSIALKWEIV